MSDILTQSPSFTGRRVLRAVPDGKGGTNLTVLKVFTWDGDDHERVLVTMHLDAKASLALARVLKAR